MREKRLSVAAAVLLAALVAAPSRAADEPGSQPPADTNSRPAAAAPSAPPPSVTIIGAAEAHGVLGGQFAVRRTRTWDEWSTSSSIAPARRARP